MNYLLPVLMTLVGIRGFAQPTPPIMLNPAQSEYSLVNHLAHYQELSHRKLPRAMLSIPKAGSFAPVRSLIPSYPLSEAAHWIRFELKPSTQPQSLVLFLDNTSINEIAFYVFRADSLSQSYEQLGWKTPNARRPIPGYQFAFPITVAAGQSYSCYLRLRRYAGTMTVPLKLFQKERYYEYSTTQNYRVALIEGSILALSLLGLFLFMRSGQWVYFWYFCQSALLAVFVAWRQGQLTAYLLPVSVKWAGPTGYSLLTLLLMGSHILFVLHFVPVQKLVPAPFRWLLYGLAYAAFVLFGSFLIEPNTAFEYRLEYGLVYGGAVSLLLLMIWGIVKREPTVLIYALADGPIMVVIVLFVSSYLIGGHFFNGWDLRTSLQITPFFEVIALCVGLVLRFDNYRRDNQMLLQNLNQAQRDIILTQESERQRIAQDLHDDVGNTLAAAKGSLSIVSKKLIIRTEFPEVARAQLLIEKAGQDLRTISHNLMPVDFEKYTLSNVIRQTVERADSSSTAIQFEFIQAGTERQLVPERSLIVYRIINELITNIQKHSGASRAIVQLIFQPETLIATVEDDGSGLRATNSGAPASGIGLKNVSSRSNYIGATLDISSDASGTCVIVEVPYA